MNSRKVSRKKLLVAFVVLIGMAIAPVFAGGSAETEAPTLDIPTQQRQYISPGNGDGVQDVLELPFSDVVIPAENMVIVEYVLSVFDGDGNLVYLVRETEDDRIGFFGNLFGGEKPRVEVPEELTWDGTYQVDNEADLPEGAANGAAVPDGEYSYQLSITDDADNTTRSAPFAVTVDNVAPTIDSIQPVELAVFSPNGDGVRDTVGVRALGSREQSWVVRLEDESGELVFEQAFENATPRRVELDPAPPLDFRWDGRFGTVDEPGELAPEGSYTLVLTGTDRAGNSVEGRLEDPIVLSLTRAAIAITVEDGVPTFSPNDDGRRDDVSLLLDAGGAGSLARWTVEIRNRGQVIRAETGTGAPPNRWLFDGRRQDGSLLPDGQIEAVFIAELTNGSVSQSEPLVLTVDTLAPVATIVADTAPRGSDLTRGLVFGVGERRSVEGSFFFERGIFWNYELRYDGRIIALGPVDDALANFGLRTRPDGDRDTVAVTWEGQALSGGGRAADGVYELVFAAVDEAGNQGVSQPIRLRKDGRTPDVGLSVDGRYVEPTISINTDYGAPDLIEEFLFEIRDGRDRVVRSEYQREPFDNFIWPGVTNGGTLVEDGDFTASLRVIYLNGHIAEVDGVGPITVDRGGPRADQLVGVGASLTLVPVPFSPDDDGTADALRIDIQLDSTRPIRTWSLDIMDPRDNTFRTFGGTGRPPASVTWDGLSDDGELVQSAMDYPVRFSAIDDQGNEAFAQAVAATDILVMREGDRFRIRISSILFAPNTPDLFLSDDEQLEQNLDTLRRLARILNRYGRREIIVEGYAAHVFLEDPQRQQEQDEVLIPLSRARATEVMQALIILGVDRDRMTVRGFGGERPVVPHSDRANIWQNRRVEFLLNPETR